MLATMKTLLMAEGQALETGAAGRAAAHARYGLYAICFGFFLVLLDTTALNVAIVAMEREFGGTISGLQWVVNSYTLVFASLLLSCGALGDRFGARRLYQIGLALFTVMSGLCALAPDVGWLIGLRMLQGLGAAIMLPASLSLLSHGFPVPAERARAVTFWAGIVSLAFAAGPALGGLLTSCFGWRSIFWLNVPVGLLALGMVRRYVREARVPDPRRIDWAGQLCACLALFSLAYGLIEAGSVGWHAPRVVTAFVLAGVLAVAFGLCEWFGPSPTLPRSLFAQRTFSVCVAIGLVLNFGMYGVLFIESLYLQNVRQLSPLSAGLMILPFTVLPSVTARIIVRFSGQEHLRLRLVIGQVLAAVVVLWDWPCGLLVIGPFCWGWESWGWPWAASCQR